jgi:hypothetical protein
VQISALDQLIKSRLKLMGKREEQDARRGYIKALECLGLCIGSMSEKIARHKVCQRWRSCAITMYKQPRWLVHRTKERVYRKDKSM